MPAAASSRKGAGGPKTAAGKARSAQNARTHGLNVLAACDPACAPEIAARAKELAGPNAGTRRLALARAAAAADVDLRRIAAARRRLFEAAATRPPPSTRSLVKACRQLQAGIAAGLQLGPRDPMADPPVARRLIRELCALERYEGRAFSRRRRALLALAAEPGPPASAPQPCACRASGDGPSGSFLAKRTRGAAALDTPGGDATPAMASTECCSPASGTPTDEARAPSADPDANQAKRTCVCGTGDDDVATTGEDLPVEPGLAGDHDGGSVPTLHQLVTLMAFGGVSHAAIARRLGLTLDILEERYADALELDPVCMAAEVARRLFAAATAGDVRACIFILKTRAGWRVPPRPRTRRKPDAITQAEKDALLARVLKLLKLDDGSPAKDESQAGDGGAADG